MKFLEADIDGMLDALGERAIVHGIGYLGIVSNDYEEYAPLGGLVRVSSSVPVVWMKDPAEVSSGYPAPTLAQNDTVTLPAGEYQVKAVKPNGQGFQEVELVEA